VRRVAVLGVPRSGTSMTVGLLRILGYRLPDAQWMPDCLLGESARLRLNANPDALTDTALAKRVMSLPDGVVWKDPCIGEYAHLMDWSSWDAVTVHRDVDEVQASEGQWVGPEWAQGVPQRVARWESTYLGSLIRTAPHRWTRIEMQDIRTEPVATLIGLAGSLRSHWDIHEDALVSVSTFIHQDSGYRCPLPGSCEVCGG
jgi:hypothetical protein